MREVKINKITTLLKKLFKSGHLFAWAKIKEFLFVVFFFVGVAG